MVLLVDLFYLVASPFFLITILFRSRFFTRRRYRAGLAEKFGSIKSRKGDRRCLWIHAVSVGEVRTSLPLLRSIAREFSDWDLVLSTSTDTGHDVAEKALAQFERPIDLIYFPLDPSWSVRRSLNAVRPNAVILIELELWPNFLMLAQRRGIPVYVANGRLTERSARRYAKVPGGRFLFSLPEGFAVQDATYERRFRDLDVPADRIEVLGNLKYDIELPGTEFQKSVVATREALDWRPDNGAGGVAVVMAGCSHPGEETTILEAFRALRERESELFLILAPRHIERTAEVVELASRADCGAVARWSEVSGGLGPKDKVRVLVVDVIGELDRFYSLADLVFIGGTFIPHGGHNILEPARFGKPVVFGPSVHNFEDMVGHFLNRNAVVQVGSGEDLLTEFERLRTDREAREGLAKRAREASTELGGAVDRHVRWLCRQLRQEPLKTSK